MIDHKSLEPDFWITNKNEYRVNIPAREYERMENGRFIVWLGGVMARYDRKKIDLLRTAELAFSDELIFSEYLGWYKFVAYDKENSAWLFFGDSCGSQYLFMDIEHARFSDRLLTLRAALGTMAEDNIEALSDMVCRGCIFGEDTLVNGLAKTDLGYYYLFHSGSFERHSKKLPRFSEIYGKKDLSDILLPIIDEVSGEKACAVCTGGTDSRTVIATLYSLGIAPELVISGHKDNPDLKPAMQIAACLGRKLNIIDPESRDYDWLEKGFTILDGMYDVVNGYRHYLIASWAHEGDFAFVFGGVAGEFYKNSYYRPVQWLFRDKKEQCRKMLFAAHEAKWLGDYLKAAIPQCEKKIDEISFKAGKEKAGLIMVNRMGYERLSAVSGSITSGYSSFCCKIDPLMDRELVASASHENIFRHDMQKWQRRQIAKTCPSLGNIPTDQGYSCTLRPLQLFAERCRKLSQFFNRVFNRIRRRLGLGFKSVEQRYWDADYSEARKSDHWQTALTYCRDKGIIRKDAIDSEIPLNMTGVLLLVGMLFGEN